MNDVNWWLMALAFLLGLLLTFAFTIRRVKREVPVYAALGRGPGIGAPDVNGPDVKLKGAGLAAGAAGVAGGVAGAKLGGGKVAADEEPYGSGSLRFAGATPPSGYPIKGNEDSKRYYLPEAPEYGDVDSEVWFRDVDDAERAGFKRWNWDVDLPDVNLKGSGGALAAGAAGIAGGAAAAKFAGRGGADGEEPYGAGSLRFAGATPPSGYTIKGNEDSMLYHTPESPSYKQTIAEVWFNAESAAEKAGFTRWDKGRAAAGKAGLVDIPAGPYGVGSAEPGLGGSGPEGWTVKGNMDSMLYHSPESPGYTATVAEVWFRDVETAEKAGFNRWDSGKSQRGKH